MTNQTSMFATDPRDVLQRLMTAAGARAKAEPLLQRFGTLGAVLAAPARELAAYGVGEQAAEFIGIINDAMTATAGEAIARREVLSGFGLVKAYLQRVMQHEPREQFRVLFLDHAYKLITDEIQNTGTINHAPVYPREVMRRALELGAGSIVLAHNHPSGDPNPSKADIEITAKIVDAARALDIAVLDHLIIGREGVASFKALGLF